MKRCERCASLDDDANMIAGVDSGDHAWVHSDPDDCIDTLAEAVKSLRSRVIRLESIVIEGSQYDLR